MLNLDAIRAFLYAVEEGSFSAAARRLGRAHSSISTAISNLEVDCGVSLFDRSGRNPVLTLEGKALLPHARGILLGNNEFLATANAMAEGIETQVCLCVEQGISAKPLMPILQQFTTKFPSVALKICAAAPGDSAVQLRQGITDIGLIAEQEGYPIGFQFRGVGYSKIIPVCAPNHPLAQTNPASYRDLRQHRQVIRHAQPVKGTTQQYEKKSPSVWHVEDPHLILDLVRLGNAWAELSVSLVANAIENGELIQLSYTFQQNDQLEGIDLVWTEQRTLGTAGQWLRDEILKLPQTIWQEKY
ncbi:LysR family transcriptional regulator [Shewanella sp. MF05960]|uniref:LysR family transcriptional regulator n=1 Tax=Shewanella sp. MF05960 TaxID=3434874 RepID=UPI003D795EA5